MAESLKTTPAAQGGLTNRSMLATTEGDDTPRRDMALVSAGSNDDSIQASLRAAVRDAYEHGVCVKARFVTRGDKWREKHAEAIKIALEHSTPADTADGQASAQPLIDNALASGKTGSRSAGSNNAAGSAHEGSSTQQEERLTTATAAPETAPQADQEHGLTPIRSTPVQPAAAATLRGKP